MLAMLCLMSACSNEPKQSEEDPAQAIQQQEQQEQEQEQQPQQEQQIQQQETPEEAEPQTTYVHTAIKGAVIDSQDGSAHFLYRKKCESCGNVEPGTTGVTSRATIKSSFRCSKCGNHQDIEIKSDIM